LTSSWDETALPGYSAGQPEITILRTIISAGVLLEGELRVVGSEGSTLRLQAGDTIIEMVDTPHYGVNEGSEDAVIIVFYAGVEGKPITVTEP
jgi:quercetin dioxygenase-like cupin family protein